ncbi:peptidoglycan-binding protein [Kribbella sp. NBC_00382]|uniref:peptidoglycan-binding domain-containing protein n=1 Tax=Kribbella sp. NBC_00382 TaxID=2975967 RepID=UPI002E245B1C
MRFLRTAITVGATAVMAVSGAVAATTSAEAAPVQVKGLEQCLSALMKPVGKGWAVQVPGGWEDVSTNCNLKYGDMPRRYGPDYVGDPASAIKALQRNLNYCYGSKLVVDGKYGSKTRTAVLAVQRKHKVTADGIYGPKTRSAMNWRMYSLQKHAWSKTCSSPL